MRERVVVRAAELIDRDIDVTESREGKPEQAVIRAKMVSAKRRPGPRRRAARPGP